MDQRTKFKNYVKNHPELLSYVKTGEMSWQKFYEMYDIYGEDHQIWNNYVASSESRGNEIPKAAEAAAAGIGFSEIMGWLKNIDLDSVRSGIGNIQRVVGVLQDFTKKDGPSSVKTEEYKPRPLYRNFED